MNRTRIVCLLSFAILCSRAHALFFWPNNIFGKSGLCVAALALPTLIIDQFVRDPQNPLNMALSFCRDTGNLESECPQAMKYINAELDRAGLGARGVRVLNSLVPGAAYDKHLVFSVRTFETLLKDPLANTYCYPLFSLPRSLSSLPRMNANVFKCCILAHEIGHLVNRDFYNIITTRFAGFFVFFALDRVLPAPTSRLIWVLNLLIKLRLSALVSSNLAKICEYRADSAAIERFKHEPEVLEDAGRFMLEMSKMNKESQSAVVRAIYSLLVGVDPHPSYYSRAQRLFDAARRARE